jgi:broad specificity phosphatase PhoE
MKLYFVRHGESDANVLHVISNRESSFGLTSLGRQQANALAGSLRGVPITAIFSSPIRRARETAEILSIAFHQTYQVTEALREYDCGILEDKSDSESWTLHREIAEDWVVRWNYDRKPEGGENFWEIRNRFVPFVEGLVKHGSQDDCVLLVGHGGLFQLMLPVVLTDIDPVFVSSHGIGHTEYILAERNRSDLICLQWGAIRFDSRESPQIS